MFDAMVIGGLLQQGIPGKAYTLNSYMDGKQYIYSVQLGLTYKITDWLSAFAGGRMNYFTGGYKGALNASAAVDLPLPPVERYPLEPSLSASTWIAARPVGDLLRLSVWMPSSAN